MHYLSIGKFTLFAPTNEAFSNIPKWANKIVLKDLLRFHVARGMIYSDDISNELLARSLLAKRDIRINVYKVGNIFLLYTHSTHRGFYRIYSSS